MMQVYKNPNETLIENKPQEDISGSIIMKRKEIQQTSSQQSQRLRRKTINNHNLPVMGNMPTTTERILRIVFNGEMRTLEELELMTHGWEDVSPTTITQQHKVSSLSIPDGWIIEDIPRKCGTRIDRYYIDPVSKVRFRSYRELVRHLSKDLEHGQDKEVLQDIKPSTVDHLVKDLQLNQDNNMKSRTSKPSTSPKISYSDEKSGLASETMINRNGFFDIFKPSEQINQILCAWKRENKSPFMDVPKVPDHVMELWRETFLFDMSATNNPYLPECVQKCIRG